MIQYKQGIRCSERITLIQGCSSILFRIMITVKETMAKEKCDKKKERLGRKMVGAMNYLLLAGAAQSTGKGCCLLVWLVRIQFQSG